MGRSNSCTATIAWRSCALAAAALGLGACTFVGAGATPPGSDASLTSEFSSTNDAATPPDTAQPDAGAGASEPDAALPPPSEVVPGAFVSIDARVLSQLRDLRALPNPVDRARMRYLDFSPLANAGASAEQLQVYREAAFLLLNSLSQGRALALPQAIDESALIYRCDLRDYGWDADTWRALEEAYPYAATYRQDSRLFPNDEASAERVRAETGAQVPSVQADWFIAHASRPPLYYRLLGLPATLSELAQQLDVDLDGDIASEDVLRAGFKTSVPSANNRVIERHERSGNRGALWRSYDFLNNLDKRNIFAHPLDFRADGSELSFQLENGLSAYFIADAAGKRLDKVPNELLRDPEARDGAAEAGLSCMSCHQLDGPIAHYDEVRDLVRTTGSAASFESVAALYGEPATLSSAFDADQARYRNARAELGIANLDNASLHALDDTHFGVLDLATAASVLGIEASALARALDASPQAFPPEFVALRAEGGGIQRDAFDAVAGAVLEALGLGTQLTVKPPTP